MTRYTNAALTREAKAAVQQTGNKRARFVRWELVILGDSPAGFGGVVLFSYYRIRGDENTEHGISIAL